MIRANRFARIVLRIARATKEGYLNRSFQGVKKGGIKGEVKRGEVVGK